MSIDIIRAKLLQIRIAKHPDGYRVWIDATEAQGMVGSFRAYRVEGIDIDIDDEARANLTWKEEEK